MPLMKLVERQWLDYAPTHRSRRTLLVHLVAVPAFIAGNVGSIVALLQGRWMTAILSLAVMAASLAWQGRCHRDEPRQPEPFSGALEAVLRIFLEQWVTFPRFVFSGGWRGALREASRQPRG